MATETLLERLLDATGEPADAGLDALLTSLEDVAADVSAPMTVGAAAQCVGVSPHTLRYYEQQGLVRPPRNASGHREYGAADLRRLVFLTRMRLSGMTMRDLTRYIALVEEGASTIPERRQIMRAQRDRLTRTIRELTVALETTEYKLRVYDGHPED
ncbi:MerR family transcriptional regulator [Microbacterium sp. HD4P20]|uniref:MerR family transcriptional regulator n=1 Tax=Microbacterium sp. HD4P20 TaxID=2864874 RepID=UPI001C63C0FD|nr:MerR family transcriptional regulator [Microbacterium sp. HD4P20]MCP2635408.1 MerR family transcriptional regulator [Microbacterium sp. HD4P20]